MFGFRVNPPDPVGDVGPNHYVEMVNLAYAVYDKQGNLLLGPVDTGTLWASFPVEDCTDPSGDPIVVYDQLEDRWLLTQFTTRGPKYYDCVAISQTGDPTGAYYRYAFITQPDPELPGGTFFPDYPKYGVWTNSYILTTRDFGDVTGYGISVYALEKNKMVAGSPKARAVQFFLDSPCCRSSVGDGLLPPDIDGTRRPLDHVAAPIIGSQDDGGGYGGTFDALNILELNVQWQANPVASLTLATQLPVASFDSIFPCARPRVTACHSRESRTQPVPGHPLLPSAPDLPPGLPQQRQVRDEGYRSIGRSGGLAWLVYAGMRSGGGTNGVLYRLHSKGHLPRVTECIAGWAAPPWTGKATSPLDIALSMVWMYYRAFAVPDNSKLIHPEV